MFPRTYGLLSSEERTLPKNTACSLHRSGKLVKIAVLVQQGGVCGYVLLVDIAGGGCQQHIHLAQEHRRAHQPVPALPGQGRSR